MSKLNFYAIYDKKAEIYNSPIVIASDAVAIRNIRAVIKDPNSLFSQFPDDFALVKVAEFNQATGDVKPQSVVVLSTFDGLLESASNASASTPTK